MSVPLDVLSMANKDWHSPLNPNVTFSSGTGRCCPFLVFVYFIFFVGTGRLHTHTLFILAFPTMPLLYFHDTCRMCAVGQRTVESMLAVLRRRVGSAPLSLPCRSCPRVRQTTHFFHLLLLCVLFLSWLACPVFNPGPTSYVVPASTRAFEKLTKKMKWRSCFQFCYFSFSILSPPCFVFKDSFWLPKKLFD